MMATWEWLALAVAGNEAIPVRASAAMNAGAMKRRVQRLMAESLGML
jgi:hypothetical protein